MNLMQRIMKTLSPIWAWGRGSGWHSLPVRDHHAGAWQQNNALGRDDLLSYHAIYAAMTLIAGDVSKLALGLVRKDSNGIWQEYENAAHSPVLRKPNHFQTRILFFENWILSLLSSGNTYVLKRRDQRGVVREMYILDPARVTVLVSDAGEVFYQLAADSIAGIGEQITVPASEIVHDRMNCLYSPLVGIPPIVACALPALQSRAIQVNAVNFFQNQSRPGGILTAPGAVSDEMVEQLRAYWSANYSGNNSGKVAILADGLKYESFQVATAQNSQVFEQLNWSAEVVASVFHIPPHKLGIGGETPAYNNIEALNVEYLNQAIGSRLEAIELLLDEGLSLPPGICTQFDTSSLLRMDRLAQMEMLDKATGKMTVNEQRKVLNLAPVAGGDSVYLQQQEFSLEALAKRDARPNPFANDNSAAETVKMIQLIHDIKGLAA